VTDIHQVLESTAASLGYELVHHELAHGGRLVRVFIERFVGVVRGASAEDVDLEVEGTVMSFAFVNLDKARLVPKLWRERQ